MRLVESGPAGGAIFASHIARQCGEGKVLSYDMGGTTAKICLIDEYRPQTSRAFEVARVYRFKKGSGLPLRIPVIEMVEIGAGGGSIARVDRLKRITVGPDSAGADPGPACYGRGGTAPTVTDADLLLGRIDPSGFSGGRMALDREAAETALRREVAEKLDLALPLAAFGVSEIVDENMANAARVHAIESGKDARGPHAGRVRRGGAVACRADGREARARPGAGAVACRGRLGGRVSARADRLRGRALAIAAARRVRPGCRQRAARRDAGGGRGDRPARRARGGADRDPFGLHAVSRPGARDRGEAAGAALSGGGRRQLLAAFEEAYRGLYSRVIPGVEIEVLSWVLLLSGPAPDDARSAGEATEAPAEPPPSYPEPARRRAVFDPDGAGFVEVAIHERAALSPGAVIPGPAVIVEDETSTVVSRAFHGADRRQVLYRADPEKSLIAGKFFPGLRYLGEILGFRRVGSEFVAPRAGKLCREQRLCRE